MGEKEIRLNRLPSITWYWLKMNEGKVNAPDQVTEAKVSAEVPEGVEASQEAENALADMPTGAGAPFNDAVNASGIATNVYRAKAGKAVKDALRLTVNYEDKAQNLNRINVIAEKNSELTVVLDMTSASDTEGTAAVQTKLDLEEGAVVHLIQIVRVGNGFTLVNDLGGREGDNAHLDIVQLVLDGKNVYQGYQIDLAGYKSYMKNDLAYRMGGDGHLDINNYANHIGRKTECEINVNGVLRERAFKVLRATINLRKGAKGAVGNEKEDVLLMDETVHNQTLPVILCTEEDVVGNHGATIGRLDEHLMFYLESRGMDREQIYEMMAAARIDATVRLIRDDRTREEITQYVGGGVEDDEE